MLIVFARSFRILVTFALILEVHGKSFFQYHEPIWQKFLVEPKDHNKSALYEFSIMAETLPVLPLCMGYPEEIS